MKARAMLESATFDPATLKTAYKAFDDAWDVVAPQLGTRPEVIEAARLKLAEIVIGLVKTTKTYPRF